MIIKLKNKKNTLGLKHRVNVRSRRNDPYWFDVYGELACAGLITIILVAELISFYIGG